MNFIIIRHFSIFVVQALLGFHGIICLCNFGDFQGMFNRSHGRHVFDDVLVRQWRRPDLFHPVSFPSWLARTSSRTLEPRYMSQMSYAILWFIHLKIFFDGQDSWSSLFRLLSFLAFVQLPLWLYRRPKFRASSGWNSKDPRLSKLGEAFSKT